MMDFVKNMSFNLSVGDSDHLGNLSLVARLTESLLLLIQLVL